MMAVEAMCPTAGKRQMTRDAAEAGAKRMRRSRDVRVSAYHCRCGWWHVGTTPVAGKGRKYRS